MPDEYLDGLSVEERAAMWAATLRQDGSASAVVLVAEDDTQGVQGFVALGSAGGEATSETGEVYALNVDPGWWGHGVGQALLGAAVETLTRQGWAKAVLWVHPDNERACRFYTQAGWVADGMARHEDVLGVEVPEIRFHRLLPAPASS